ncbi:MAG TPA: response regulator, partial [Thermoanaerobaculia bacterium]|nr:response regulator [Thermoanaerobaculia bacterium]
HRVVRFEVRDTGIGIDPENRLLLFERFSQIDGGTNRRYQGAGLGLAAARHLVETLGGLIDVDSVPGSGSTFWFTIPFPKQTAPRKPVASSDLEFAGKRVLLIDAVPTSARMIRHYLEDVWEMRVERASTAAEAFALLRRDALADPIRVVFYDALPDCDALAFAREIRTDPSLGSTSVVHLLSSSDVVNRAKMREAGISAYLTKPAGQSELSDALAVALAQDAIPLARRAEQPPPARETKPLSAEQRKSVRVLLVEDNFLNAKLTMQQLQKLGFHADSVGNGQEAIEAVEKNRYHVVLMDCQMPIVDGYEATMEIRRQEKAQKLTPLRIIAMTANALEGDREKCLAAGMDDYLSKPTRADDLDAALCRSAAASVS